MQKSQPSQIIDLPLNKTVALIKINDSATIKKLYKSNFRKVKNYVLQNNGSAAEAKDIYQEAFVAMWRNIKNDKFVANSETALNGYVFQIAKHKWLDHLRSASYKNTTFINREMEYFETENEEDEFKNQQLKIILESISKLGERCQLLLKLFYFKRQSFKKIAKLTQMDEASARNAKYRCLEQLRKMTQSIPNGPK